MTQLPLKKKGLKIVTDQIDCKDIGTVKKEMAIYSLIPFKNPEYNNFVLTNVYLETLQAITHKDS